MSSWPSAEVGTRPLRAGAQRAWLLRLNVALVPSLGLAVGRRHRSASWDDHPSVTVLELSEPTAHSANKFCPSRSRRRLSPLRPAARTPRALPAWPAQFLLGDDLLVHPVTEPGATTWTTYLPAGQWIDVWTGQVHDGGRTIERNVPRDIVPVYCRAQSWNTLRAAFAG